MDWIIGIQNAGNCMESRIPEEPGDCGVPMRW